MFPVCVRSLGWISSSLMLFMLVRFKHDSLAFSFDPQEPYKVTICILKGTVSRDFLLLVFSWISFPPAPEYSSKTVSNFFENSRGYSQFRVHHRYQRHRRQIFPPVSLALLITVANLPPVSTILPPVSTTPVANCHRYQQHRRQIATSVIDTVGAIIKLLTT